VNAELEHAFVTRFPGILREAHADPTTGHAAWGLDVPDAWAPPLWGAFAAMENLCERVNAAAPGMGFAIHALQVKEKFGGLRVYWRPETAPEYPPPGHMTPEAREVFDGALHAVDAIVDTAERTCARVCDTCGVGTAMPGTAPNARPRWGVRCATCEGLAAARAEILCRLSGEKISETTETVEDALLRNETLAARAEVLRTERDEARRMGCYSAADGDPVRARRVAEERGWDCFTEDTKQC
jgi:hypothetical protein